MPSNSVIAGRNERIIEQLNAGARVADVASAFNLSQSRVRAIRTQYAASPTASKQGGDSQRAGAFGEIGLTGLNYSAGYVQEEFLRELNSSTKRYKIFNEMRNNDPVIAAILLLTEMLCRGVEWRIDGEEDERTEFIEGARTDMSDSWNSFISEVLTMIPFGFSFFEVVYKRRLGTEAAVSSEFNDGKIGWRRFAFRSQDSLHSWEFDERGNVQGMNQMVYPDYRVQTIPLSKALLFRTSTEKNNPEGRSLLRPAYVPYYYKKNLQAIEAIGAERDLAGLPVVKLPEGADTTSENSTDIVAARKLVQRIRVDEQGGVVLPPGWEVELMNSGGGKSFDVGEIISRYEKRMAMVILAQFLLLGMDKVGSFALSGDQSDLFIGAVNAILDIICETFNKFAITPLLKLNGMSLENAPKLAHGAVGKPNLEALQQYFGGLTAYIKPDVELEQHLRKIADAPELSEEEIARREEERERMMAIQPAMVDEDGTPVDEQGKPIEDDEADKKPDGKQDNIRPMRKRPPPAPKEKAA
jgi:phage gp29-like protein